MINRKYLKPFFLVLILLGLSGITFGSVFAQRPSQAISSTGEGYFPPPLCLPGMPDDGTCLVYGPAQTVKKMKESGFPYPIRELPAAHPPDDLAEMPVFIAKINYPEDEPVPVFASFDDAVAGENPVYQIPIGTMRYISYVTWLDHNGKAFLQLPTGGWLRASPAAYTDFQGMAFFDNPDTAFGWVYLQAPIYTAPSYLADTKENMLNQGDFIQVFNVVEGENATWYQIAPDSWVESAKAKVISVNPMPPEGVDADRWIEINLYQQILSVYEDGQLLFATLVSTGIEPIYTRPGIFQIYEKKPIETMQGAFMVDRSDFYYLEDVPWTMYYDQARAMHAAYWRTHFGFPQSHGCVNLSPADANWLYQWAEEGDFVWVHDPSGQTPTDPDHYGPGAP